MKHLGQKTCSKSLGNGYGKLDTPMKKTGRIQTTCVQITIPQEHGGGVIEAIQNGKPYQEQIPEESSPLFSTDELREFGELAFYADYVESRHIDSMRLDFFLETILEEAMVKSLVRRMIEQGLRLSVKEDKLMIGPSHLLDDRTRWLLSQSRNIIIKALNEMRESCSASALTVQDQSVTEPGESPSSSPTMRLSSGQEGNPPVPERGSSSQAREVLSRGPSGKQAR